MSNDTEGLKTTFITFWVLALMTSGWGWDLAKGIWTFEEDGVLAPVGERLIGIIIFTSPWWLSIFILPLAVFSALNIGFNAVDKINGK